MSLTKTAVFGIYHTGTQAERSIDDLLAAGFTNDDISILRPDGHGSRVFAYDKNTQAPEGITVGVTAGGALGGTLGLMAGIGVLAIPGVGSLIAAGPIVGALAGLGAGGAAGWFIGALLAEMDITEHEEERAEGQIKEDGVLVSIHCVTSDEIARAKVLLEQTGAQDISSSGHGSADFEWPARSRRSRSVVAG